MHGVMWILALGFGASAAWLDWRSRRIPNWLTVPGLLIGVAINTAMGGWDGAKGALGGAALALGLLLPIVLLRGLGAGDWKLMGALGAFLGPRQILIVILSTVFIAGMMAVVQVLWNRRVIETAKNLAILVYGFIVFGLRPNQMITLDNANLLKLPFGVAAALGTALCYGAKAAFGMF